jgi:hypothetical protein
MEAAIAPADVVAIAVERLFEAAVNLTASYHPAIARV